MTNGRCAACGTEASQNELETGICGKCGATLADEVSENNGRKPAGLSRGACALCGQTGATDCFLRGVIREGGVLATPGQSNLRLYYVKCPCCDDCFQRVAQFNRIRTRGIGLALLSLALGLGGLPLLAWLADAAGFRIAVPMGLMIGAGVVGVVGMFATLGATSHWVGNNLGMLLNPQFDAKLRALAQVEYWTGMNFPCFTRRPIDNQPHFEL